MYKLLIHKCLLILFGFFAVQIVVEAQEDYHYTFNNGAEGLSSGYSGVQASMNASLFLPLSDVLNKRYPAGIGANVQLKYLVDSKFSIGIYGAFNLLSSRPAQIGVTNSLLQYGAMFEYFLYRGSSPYIGLDLGIHSFGQNISGSATGQVSSSSYSLSSFGVGPNIGYIIVLNPNMSLNTNLKYNHAFNSIINIANIPTQYFQVSVGLIFNLSYRSTKTDE